MRFWGFATPKCRKCHRPKVFLQKTWFQLSFDTAPICLMWAVTGRRLQAHLLTMRKKKAAFQTRQPHSKSDNRAETAPGAHSQQRGYELPPMGDSLTTHVNGTGTATTHPSTMPLVPGCISALMEHIMGPGYPRDPLEPQAEGLWDAWCSSISMGSPRSQ